jgi:hypothetical protein
MRVRVKLGMKQSPPPLNDEQTMAELLAMMARNNLEDLHAGDGEISDRLMKKINQRFRNAIYTGLHAVKWQHRSPSARRWVDHHGRSIPSYWEAPELIPSYRDGLEPGVEGPEPAALNPDSSKDQASLLKIRTMLDWIAQMQTIGSPLRGARREEFRSELERYAVDWMAKTPPAERFGSHLLVDEDYYRFLGLEAELVERVKALVSPGSASHHRGNRSRGAPDQST